MNGAPTTGRDSAAWIRVTRTGEVTASVVDEAWTWTNAAGDVLQAKRGDWRVSNADGDVWSVVPEVFEATYEHIAGTRWRRIGEARARPAVEGEVVESLEGLERARAGDWVMEGAAGERWVTSAEHFSANYSRI